MAKREYKYSETTSSKQSGCARVIDEWGICRDTARSKRANKRNLLIDQREKWLTEVYFEKLNKLSKEIKGVLPLSSFFEI